MNFVPKQKPLIWRSELTRRWYYSIRYSPVKGAKKGVVAASIKTDITDQMEELIELAEKEAIRKFRQRFEPLKLGENLNQHFLDGTLSSEVLDTIVAFFTKRDTTFPTKEFREKVEQVGAS